MADRIRKTETSQGISNQGGLMDVIFNSCSGKVKTTGGQCVSLSHQDCRKPEEKNQRPCWTHLTGPLCGNDFLVGAETTEGTGNGTVWGRLGSVVMPSYSSSLISDSGEPALLEPDWCGSLAMRLSGWCWLRPSKVREGKHGRANGCTAQESSGTVTPEKKSSIRSAKVF